MSGNNSNQNLTNEQNKAKSPAKGFTGMGIPASDADKSAVEASEARKKNAELGGAGKERDQHPF